MARKIVVSAFWILALLCSGCAKPPPPVKPVGVAFFTPRGIPSELVSKMEFGMINAVSTNQVSASLKMVQGRSFKVNVDFGPVVAQSMSPASIKTTYQDLDGNQLTKAFTPLSPAKLRQFPSDNQIRILLAPYFDVLKDYAPNVGTVFLADEPYLNGITKSEMERAGRVARQELDARGLKSVKLGVIFASAMFDSNFASLMNKQAGEYAKGIDQYYRDGQAVLNGTKTDPAFNAPDFLKWVATITASRLTTYDNAGNMYTGGGIPDGFDVVGYDFYLSTILQDSLHEHTLSWFAANLPSAGCGQFAGQTMRQIRSKLSFFHDGPILQGTRYQDNDRLLLDAIFQCRMQAATTMLVNQLGSRRVDVLMISESSNNGVLEFDAAGNPKAGQPNLLVEARALEEVKRAQAFYASNLSVFTAGLMFFTYDNEYDLSIGLNIGGASGMPSVLATIDQFAIRWQN